MIISRTTQIDATPEQLWQCLTEFELLKRWTPSLVSDEPISSGPAQVGHRSRMMIREGSKLVEYENEITGYQPPGHLGIVLRGGSLGKGPMAVDYHLAQDGTGTSLRYESKWKAHGFMLKVMAPVISVMANRHADDAMRRLKELAEERS